VEHRRGATDQHRRPNRPSGSDYALSAPAGSRLRSIVLWVEAGPDSERGPFPGVGCAPLWVRPSEEARDSPILIFTETGTLGVPPQSTQLATSPTRATVDGPPSRGRQVRVKWGAGGGGRVVTVAPEFDDAVGATTDRPLPRRREVYAKGVGSRPPPTAGRGCWSPRRGGRCPPVPRSAAASGRPKA